MHHHFPLPHHPALWGPLDIQGKSLFPFFLGSAAKLSGLVLLKSFTWNEQFWEKAAWVWSGMFVKAWDPQLMNIIWSCLGLSHYLCNLHLALCGPDSFIPILCLTRKALQLLSSLVSFLFNLRDPVCSNFAFSNFIFTFKVNVICQANHIFFGSLSVKLFLNLTFLGAAFRLT